jgi:MotA/TolQ/ExbB proton channel family
MENHMQKIPHKANSILASKLTHYPFILLGYWVASLLPVVLVVTIALTYFRQAVISSIATTPHPELVYAILGTFFVGVVLTSLTLYRYSIEVNLMRRWWKTPVKDRAEFVSSQCGGSYFMPLYKILLANMGHQESTLLVTLEQEMSAIADRLKDRLALPNYLSGALVGLGLVGTFVGLLGTLEDLGKLFGALVQTSSANTNPTELFADMVGRLQEPMRGMGTAFVASLYGLLGSLLLGLQILAVGKVEFGLYTQMHRMVRGKETDDQKQKSEQTPSLLSSRFENRIASTLSVATQSLQDTQILLQQSTDQWLVLSQKIQQQQAQAANENATLRAEIFTIVQACQILTQSVRESIEADHRYRQTVPKTTYWQDAWIKVQAYLQRSNSDQALTELIRATSSQQRILIDMSSTLIRIEQKLAVQNLQQPVTLSR